MALTVAVETVIGQHYNDQIRELLQDGTNKDPELTEVFKRHRDEEMEHLDTGLKHDAQKAPFYDLITTAVKVGCSAAISVAKRI